MRITVKKNRLIFKLKSIEHKIKPYNLSFSLPHLYNQNNKNNNMKRISALLLFLPVSTFATALDTCIGLIQKKEYAQAERVCTIEAETGDNDAQYELSRLYLIGENVSVNYKKSRYWAEAAARQENAEAQLLLGVTYLEGHGTNKNPELAIKWFKKAAENGNIRSASILGDLYYEGNIVPQDIERSVRYYQSSALSGDDTAQENLSIIYYRGSGTIKKDHNRSFAWASMAAIQGNARSLSILGLHFLNGQGVPENKAMAYAYFLAAKKKGVENLDDLINIAKKGLKRSQYVNAQITKDQILSGLSLSNNEWRKDITFK
ncbi:tetratricopeptide repeat protein [Spongorhabdus nitratireducens]